MLYNKIPQILGGSALAGFGLSFGRDVYRSSKKNAGPIILVIIAVVTVFLPRQAIILLVRNYRSKSETYMYRIGAAIMYISIAPISFLCITFFVYILFLFPFLLPSTDLSNKVIPPLITILYGNPISEYLLFTWVAIIDESTFSTSVDQELRMQLARGGDDDLKFVWSSVVAGLIFFLLLVSGYQAGKRHRKIREAAWAAERHNKAFLSSVGLEELANEQFRDSEGTLYRLENEFKDRIELFAIGRRNRRGYLHFDETGKFTKWSGLVALK